MTSECPPKSTRVYGRNNLKLAKSIFNLDLVWECGIFQGESELSPEAGELEQQPWLLHFEKTEWLGVAHSKNGDGLPAKALSQDPARQSFQRGRPTDVFLPLLLNLDPTFQLCLCPRLPLSTAGLSVIL